MSRCRSRCAATSAPPPSGSRTSSPTPAATTGSQFGFATSTTRTNLPLIVRLQAPRFFVVGDRTTISAVINNNSDEAMSVAPAIEVKGLKVVEQTLLSALQKAQTGVSALQKA